MTPGELSLMLARDAERVCQHLLPNGKREGHEWCVGSVGGEEGRSLKVHLSGDKAGVWSDFAEGISGDLIDLWVAVNGRSLREALPEIRAYLGVPASDLGLRRGGPAKAYAPPVIPDNAKKPKGEAALWLTQRRKITDQAIKVFRLASSGDRVYFPFLDPDGNRVMLKWRSIRDKKTAPTSKDQRPCLFGWQAVPKDCRGITICEGELDAISLWMYGHPALSVPFGGGRGAKQAWIEHEYENLEQFDTIFLALDNDEIGHEATVEIIERLGRHRCRVVTLPKKDANECLMADVQPSEIQKCFDRAQSHDPEGLKFARDYLDSALERLYPDPDAPQDWIDLPWSKAHDKIQFRRRELVITFGINGHGKSHLVNQFGLQTMRQGERVMIASMEYQPEDLLADMLVQASGVERPTTEYARAIGGWLGERLLLWGHTGTAKISKLFEVLEYSWKRYHTRHFVIDSLLKCGLSEDDYNGQKHFVEQLADFKNRTDSTIHLVCHARKQMDETKAVSKMDLRGSSAITDLADTVLSITRNKVKENKIQMAELEGVTPDPELTSKPDAVLDCSKQRRGRWEGKLNLWFTPCGQFVGTQDGRPFQFVQFTQAVEDRNG